MPRQSFIEGATNQWLAGGPARYVAKLTQRSRSNFYYAFLFLPREQREALEAIYAYCRLVDDVVDEEAPDDVKREGIEKWRRELDAVFSSNGHHTNHPVAARLRAAVREFPIRREDLEGVIDGCEMDISVSRYADWSQLHQYCYRVASCVGLMCIEIFGYQTPRARDYAIDLGVALQLTNILRDVAEDAKRGRIYLPQDELRAFGVSEDDLRAGRRTPAFLRLMRHNAARARSHYLRARAAIGDVEKRKLVIAEIMGDIYYKLLTTLEASDFDVFSGKLSVPRGQKMAIALGRFAQAKLQQIVSPVA